MRPRGLAESDQALVLRAGGVGLARSREAHPKEHRKPTLKPQNGSKRLLFEAETHLPDTSPIEKRWKKKVFNGQTIHREKAFRSLHFPVAAIRDVLVHHRGGCIRVRLRAIPKLSSQELAWHLAPTPHLNAISTKISARKR